MFAPTQAPLRLARAIHPIAHRGIGVLFLLAAASTGACSDPSDNGGAGDTEPGGTESTDGGSGGGDTDDSGATTGDDPGTSSEATGGDGDGDTAATTGDESGFEVESVSPANAALTAARDAPVRVTFNRAVDPSTVDAQSLWLFGRFSGPIRDAAYTFEDDDRTVVITPPRTFSAGDRVTVVVSHDVAAPDGTQLRDEGYSSQFWTRAEAAPLSFEEVQTLSTRTMSRTQSYGGSATDLDGDGYLDLMVINEITADLRILMNRGDGTGQFDMLEDFVLLDDRASPSETTDFNGDGIVDLVVANLDGDNLSILFGDGTGMLSESQKIDVGEEPRGVAVFDFDGDGDVDIANTNANSDNMSVLLNDGTGIFPETEAEGLVFFDAGHGQADVGTEFGLMAGDMNEDGLLDLVIGARGTGRSGTIVNFGVGDGTFAFGSAQAPATTPWQLAVGDLNGDGHEDVVTADGSLQESADTVTVLVGDGAGALSDRQLYQDRILQPFAIDTGDLDGDGDLDVVVSNFSGDWEILENDGDGQLTRAQSVESTQGSRGSASCAILMDIDNDGDLDLALIDEIEDEVTFMRH